MKPTILKFTALAVLLGLLLNPSLSFKGAGDGLRLWFNVVFPTLFPFMTAANLAASLGAVPLLMMPFGKILRPILKLGSDGSYTFLTGLLCGYPMGAKTAADFVTAGRLSAREGAYLLSISNFPSMMFLMGYVLPLMSPGTGFLHVFLSILLPVLPMSWLSRKIYKIQDLPCVSKVSASSPPAFDTLLVSSLEVMEKICGYLMLFSILAAFWNHYIPDTFPLKHLILSLVEMTVGIRETASFQSGLRRDTALVAAAAFGGLSGAAQTQTVIKNAGLSIRHYIAWKWLHLALSSLVFMILDYLPLPSR